MDLNLKSIKCIQRISNSWYGSEIWRKDLILRPGI